MQVLQLKEAKSYGVAMPLLGRGGRDADGLVRERERQGGKPNGKDGGKNVGKGGTQQTTAKRQDTGAPYASNTSSRPPALAGWPSR